MTVQGVAEGHSAGMARARRWRVGYMLWFALACAVAFAAAFFLAEALGSAAELLPVTRRRTIGRNTTAPGFGMVALAVGLLPALLAEWLALRPALQRRAPHPLKDSLLVPAYVAALLAAFAFHAPLTDRPGVPLLAGLVLGALAGASQLLLLYRGFAHAVTPPPPTPNAPRPVRASPPPAPTPPLPFAVTPGAACAVWIGAGALGFAALAVVVAVLGRLGLPDLPLALTGGGLLGALYGLPAGLLLARLRGDLPPDAASY